MTGHESEDKAVERESCRPGPSRDNDRGDGGDFSRSLTDSSLMSVCVCVCVSLLVATEASRLPSNTHRGFCES